MKDTAQTLQKPPFAIHPTRTFRNYRPILAHHLKEQIDPIRFETDEHDDKMPIFINGWAEHVVMLCLLGGDGWSKAVIDLFASGCFKEPKLDGPNVEILTAFFPFPDTRADRPKEIVGPDENLYQVKADGSLTSLLINLMRYVAKVDNQVWVDNHSELAVQQAEAAGMEVVNLTLAFRMLDNLVERGVINDDLENVVCGVDFGNLALIKTISDRCEWPMAVMEKKRILDEDGVSTTTEHKFVFGDVSGKRVILYDDIIGTGGTLIKTVNELLEQGVVEIVICASHSVFAGREYYKRMEKLLAMDKVKTVMTSDSIPLRRPGFGGLPTFKSMAYVGEGGSKKQVEFFPTQDFISEVLEVLKASGGDAEKMRAGLAADLIPPELARANKYDLATEITGIEFKEDELKGVYKGKGQFQSVP